MRHATSGAHSEINHQGLMIKLMKPSGVCAYQAHLSPFETLTLTQVLAQIVFKALIGAFTSQNCFIAHRVDSDEGGSALDANHSRPEMLLAPSQLVGTLL